MGEKTVLKQLLLKWGAKSTDLVSAMDTDDNADRVAGASVDSAFTSAPATEQAENDFFEE
jgi:recombinational DNA repair protein RecT